MNGKADRCRFGDIADDLILIAEHQHSGDLSFRLDPEIPLGGPIGNKYDKNRSLALGNDDRLPPEISIRLMKQPILARLGATVCVVGDRRGVAWQWQPARPWIRR